MNRILQVLILIVLVALVVFWATRPAEEPVVVTDFESCVAAGGSIMESQPRQCALPGGDSFTEEAEMEAEVVVNSPEYGTLVTSPLTVAGQARGFWFFEANIPVTLKDQNGKVLAQKGFQAQGEWMTEDFVQFEDTLEFETPDTEFGVLIIQKDNPSGLPEHDASFAVPVRFR